jgi:ubiquinone/menaquinone biosynthesis C-methylase UbiE
MGNERLQRQFWDRVYDRLAPLYDAVDWLTGYTTHRFRRRALPYLPAAGRLLEVGFGSGQLHLELAAQYEMAGIDLAPGMVRLTRRRLAQHDLASRLCVGNACALPWPADHFDGVISTFALSAVPDLQGALAEMIRVTRPGGVVVIVDAGEALDGNPGAHFLARLWEAMGDYMRDEAAEMAAQGLAVQREDVGPWGSVHVVAGTLVE